MERNPDGEHAEQGGDQDEAVPLEDEEGLQAMIRGHGGDGERSGLGAL